MTLNKVNLAKKLTVLIATLSLVVAGVSCKSKAKPGEGGLDLERPTKGGNIVNQITNAGGLLSDSELNNWNDEMIQIRQLAESSDGGYRRSPVIASFGDLNGKKHKFITVMEKRYGRSGEKDVAIDGNSLVELVYQYSIDSGNTISTNEAPIGRGASEPSLSRGAPVVFVGSDKTTVGIVAAAGGGMFGGSQGSQIKIIKGTASDDNNNITWDKGGDWANLKFKDEALNKLTNKSATNDANKAILAYIKQKMDGTKLQGKGGDFKAKSFYLKSGVGGVSGDKWVLAITALDINLSTHANFGILIIYSEDKGETWDFGPFAKPIGGGQTFPWSPNDTSSDYRESQVVAFDGAKVTVVASPNTIHDSTPSQMYVFSGNYNDDKELTLTRTGITDATGGVGLAQDTKDKSKYYLVNTRKRVPQYNRVLTVSETTLDMNTGRDLKITGVSGVGSIAVLGDGSILLMAEEAFAEGSRENETKFNIVQRRFTPGYFYNYLQKGGIIKREEEYYNPGYDIVAMDK